MDRYRHLNEHCSILIAKGSRWEVVNIVRLIFLIAVVPDPLNSFISQLLATSEPFQEAMQPKSIQHHSVSPTHSEGEKMASSHEQQRKMICESFLRTMKNLKSSPHGKLTSSLSQAGLM